MKTLPLAISLLMTGVFFPLLAQNQLLVRELSSKVEAADTVPVRDLLLEYDEQGRQISETLLVPNTSGSGWRRESVITQQYDASGNRAAQRKEIYSAGQQAPIVVDDLHWAYNAASLQTRYQLLRTRDSIQEGFLYTYEYDTNGCQVSRTGRTWSETTHSFVLSDSTITLPDAACRPQEVYSYQYNESTGIFGLAYSYRYEYEQNAAALPVAERTYLTQGQGPEELISEFTWEYGQGYEKRAFIRFDTDQMYRDSLAFDENGRRIYRIEWSNVFSNGILAPSRESRWKYDDLGREISHQHRQIWNQQGEFWQNRSLDSMVYGEFSETSIYVLETWTGPQTRSRQDVETNTTFLSCDSLPVKKVISYQRDGLSLGFSTIRALTYAGNSTCEDVLWETQLQCYPNPVSSDLHIRSGLLKEQQVIVQLINLNGEIVREEAHRYSGGLIIRVSDLAGGLYLVRVLAQDQSLARKVMIE